MKIKAGHWVNYNGTWHPKGEVFEIDPEHEHRAAFMGEIVDPEPALMEEHIPEATAEPVKRGRKRKADE